MPRQTDGLNEPKINKNMELHLFLQEEFFLMTFSVRESDKFYVRNGQDRSQDLLEYYFYFILLINILHYLGLNLFYANVCAYWCDVIS